MVALVAQDAEEPVVVVNPAVVSFLAFQFPELVKSWSGCLGNQLALSVCLQKIDSSDFAETGPYWDFVPQKDLIRLLAVNSDWVEIRENLGSSI